MALLSLYMAHIWPMHDLYFDDDDGDGDDGDDDGLCLTSYRF